MADDIYFDALIAQDQAAPIIGAILSSDLTMRVSFTGEVRLPAGKYIGISLNNFCSSIVNMI